MSSFIADRRPLPRLVVLLSIVSLLNDAASEMITPLLPLVVAGTLGGGPLIISAIEGLADATASLLKLASGWLADRGWSLRWMVIGGYALSNLARPLIGLASAWGGVMGLRFLDRAGKGIRTSPRDALISAAVETAERGRAFGYHRAMDHGGAIIGPLLAWPLLAIGVSPQNVFLAAAVPGVLVLLVLWYALPARAAAPALPVAWPRWSILDRRLQGLIVAAAALTLSTLPEALLVLWVHQVGGIETLWVPVLWAAAHVVKAFFAYAAGTVSDRVGRLPVVIARLVRAGRRLAGHRRRSRGRGGGDRTVSLPCGSARVHRGCGTGPHRGCRAGGSEGHGLWRVSLRLQPAGPAQRAAVRLVVGEGLHHDGIFRRCRRHGDRGAGAGVPDTAEGNGTSGHGLTRRPAGYRQASGTRESVRYIDRHRLYCLPVCCGMVRSMPRGSASRHCTAGHRRVRPPPLPQTCRGSRPLALIASS